MPNDHYYTAHPTSEHHIGRVDYAYRDIQLSFETDSGVFSKRQIDEGTDLLLSCLPESIDGDVLDMGCGYGVMGIAIGAANPNASITMSDINERAVALADKNARANRVNVITFRSDGYSEVLGKKFDTIVQNPPIRAGKAVIYQMFKDAASCLTPGGTLWLVIRKQQGAPSALNYLNTLYSDVVIVKKERGYWIFRCEKPIGEKGYEA